MMRQFVRKLLRNTDEAMGRQEARRARFWQTDPMRDHQVRITTSPGRDGQRGLRPTNQAVRLSDGTVYRVWSDGSFRGQQMQRPDGSIVSIRRPSGLSGRQRRLQRRALSRAARAYAQRMGLSRDNPAHI